MKASNIEEMIKQVKSEVGFDLVQDDENLVVFGNDEGSIAFESMQQAFNDWNNNDWF